MGEVPCQISLCLQQGQQAQRQGGRRGAGSGQQAQLPMPLMQQQMLPRGRMYRFPPSSFSSFVKEIHHELKDGLPHEGTVTSMKPNEGTFILRSEIAKRKTKPVHVVDVPGHSRLRQKLDEFLPQAAAIVFVVDAVEFLPNCRAASEYLYDILTKATGQEEDSSTTTLQQGG